MSSDFFKKVKKERRRKKEAKKEEERKKEEEKKKSVLTLFSNIFKNRLTTAVVVCYTMSVNKTRTIKCPRCREGVVAIGLHLPERELVSALQDAPQDSNWVVEPCTICHYGRRVKPLFSHRRAK